MTLSEEDVRRLRELEEGLWRAESRFDDAWMRRVLADDFFEFGRSGRVYRREEILNVSAQEIRAVLPLPGLEVRAMSADVALVTYISELSSEAGPERANRSSIWSQTADGWRLRFHQGTPVPNS